jgi:hypothetical protein
MHINFCLQVSQVLQNLTNDILYNAKAPHLIPVNHFLSQNMERFHNFLLDLADVEETTPPVVSYDCWQQKVVIKL